MGEDAVSMAAELNQTCFCFSCIAVLRNRQYGEDMSSAL